MTTSRYYICQCDAECRDKQKSNSFKKFCRCFHHRTVTGFDTATGAKSASVDVLPPRSEFSFYPSKKRPQ